jgi:hypothetical protein
MSKKLFGIRAIPSEIIVVKKLIQECLTDRITYPDLSNLNYSLTFSNDDIEFVIKKIFKLCKLDESKENFNNSEEKDFFAVWVTLTTSSTNTGRFALTYNQKFNHCVGTKNELEFEEIWKDGIMNFVELYKNTLLSDKEKQSVHDMVMTEYHAILMSIDRCINDMGNFNINGNGKILNNQQETNIFKLNGNLLTIYGLCYSEICATKKNYNNYPGMDKIPNRIMYPQTLEDKSIKIVCVDTLKLIHEVSEKTLNKPDENNKLIDKIIKKFPCEIKLYQYYLKDNPPGFSTR